MPRSGSYQFETYESNCVCESLSPPPSPTSAASHPAATILSSAIRVASRPPSLLAVVALRYMVDRGIVGCSWVTCPASKWRARPWQSQDGRHMEHATHCQLEVDLHFSDVREGWKHCYLSL